MRYKIYKKEKTQKYRFLILPRYCGKCMLAFWLEKIPVGGDSLWYELCPICKGELCHYKNNALGE